MALNGTEWVFLALKHLHNPTHHASMLCLFFDKDFFFGRHLGNERWILINLGQTFVVWFVVSTCFQLFRPATRADL